MTKRETTVRENMGASNSTSVVRIGDWEHEFCWMDAEDNQVIVGLVGCGISVYRRVTCNLFI